MTNEEQTIQPQPETPSTPEATATLKSPVDLFGKAWELFMKKKWHYLKIIAIPYLLSIPLLFTGAIMSTFSGSLTMVGGILIIVLMVIILILVNVWATVALLYAIMERDKELTVKETYQKAWSKILDFIGVSILSFLIIAGGFILFIVPGIIFSVWYSLAFYVFMKEDLTGMAALRRSKELVVGRWWSVLWRLIFPSLIYIAIGLALGVVMTGFSYILGETISEFLTNVIDTIFRIVVTPVGFIYGFLLLDNLVSAKK